MPLPKEERYTLADALEWPEKLRIELIEGQPYMMAPPKRIHQVVSRELFGQLYDYLKDKKCQVFAAPFAVRPFETEGEHPEDVDTMVEPDLSVICDREKLDDIGCKGAPDLVIEILSASTAKLDRHTKLRLYERAGVREYWIVDPEKQIVLVHLLEDGHYYSPMVYTGTAQVKVEVLDDCMIDLGRVFEVQ